MSTNKHTNPAYISHVHLKGYKSIIDTEVELHPGLNIIIGPNGSGKTNFCQLIHQFVTFHYSLIENNFHAKIIIKFLNKEYLWEIKSEGRARSIGNNQFVKGISEKFYEESQGNLQEDNFYYINNRDIDGKLNLAYRFFIENLNSNTFIWFNSPKESLSFRETDGLSNQLSFKVNKEDLRLEELRSTSSTFVNHFISENFYFADNLEKDIFLSNEQLLNYLQIDKEVIRNLKKFSPIKLIRLEKGLSINENGRYFSINYLGFQFSVNGNWLTWNELSDGTKRLFYIISEVTLNKGLCFIEEPEIGVHPDQYRKTLNFLKEQSEEKQIIITTHAPKTLDILDDNELDRIILTRYGNELGTKMRHLSEEEQNHAVKFMLEESFFLSDFWTLTSFFDEEEEDV